MSHAWTQLYVHCVWATHGRLPLITSQVEPRLYSAIIAKVRDFDCHLLAIGGVEDHVHLFVRFPPTIALSLLMKEVKGASSHLMNHDASTGEAFKWQVGYGAFTVSKRSVDSVVDYVRNQKARHANRQLIDDLERANDDE